MPGPHLISSKSVAHPKGSDDNQTASGSYDQNSPRTPIINDQKPAYKDKGKATEYPLKPWNLADRETWGTIIAAVALFVAFFAWRASSTRNTLERPWIIVFPDDPKRSQKDESSIITQLRKFLTGKTEPPIFPSQTEVSFTATNFGRSPAFVRRICCRLRVLDLPLPNKPDYGKAENLPQFILAPSNFKPHSGKVAYPISYADAAGMQAGNKALVFYGFIEYQSTMTWRWRWWWHNSRFCAMWLTEDGREIFRPVGPNRNWTEYT